MIHCSGPFPAFASLSSSNSWQLYSVTQPQFGLSIFPFSSSVTGVIGPEVGLAVIKGGNWISCN